MIAYLSSERPRFTMGLKSGSITESSLSKSISLSSYCTILIDLDVFRRLLLQKLFSIQIIVDQNIVQLKIHILK